MTGTTPIEALRAAADRVEQLADAASPGLWTAVHERPAGWTRDYHGVQTGVRDVAECPWRGGDADYVAAMQPRTGRALAALLRIVASDAVEAGHEHLPGPGACTPDTCALAAAQQVARVAKLSL